MYVTEEIDQGPGLQGAGHFYSGHGAGISRILEHT